MKIFLDTAHTESIQKWAQTGLIDGVTTNPTNLSREKTDPTQQILTICDILPNGIISVEVTEKDPESVYFQARKIASLSNNIAVKIPCHPSYYYVIKKLVEEGISLNITLVFSLSQGLMMAKLGVDYISPFVGRLDDTGADGIELIHNLRHVLDWYGFETQLLAASIRDTKKFEKVIMAGADIATIPVQVLEQSLTHELTDAGIQQFLTDWQKLNISTFP